MNQLLDVVGDDEEHELTGMLELLGQLVEDFEHPITRCPMPSLAKCYASSWTSMS